MFILSVALVAAVTVIVQTAAEIGRSHRECAELAEKYNQLSVMTHKVRVEAEQLRNNPMGLPTWMLARPLSDATH